MLDVNLFNEASWTTPTPSSVAAPSPLAPNGWNSSEKTFTAVPNDKWWGEKPKLDRIVVREMATLQLAPPTRTAALDVVNRPQRLQRDEGRCKL